MKASLSQHQQTSAEKEHKLNSSEGVHTQGLRQYSIFYCHTLSIISSLLQWISCILNPLLNETPFEHCWQPQLPECHRKLRLLRHQVPTQGTCAPLYQGTCAPLTSTVKSLVLWCRWCMTHYLEKMLSTTLIFCLQLVPQLLIGAAIPPQPSPHIPNHQSAILLA